MKKLLFFTAALTVLCVQLSQSLVAHEGHSHQQKNTTAHTVTPADNIAAKPFPSLHPLVVHFPIVLLILAAVLQLAGMFIYQRMYHYTITVIMSTGAVTAYLAANTFHVHTGTLPPAMADILIQHEKFAAWTVWLSVAAVILKVISLFFGSPSWKSWTQWGTSIVILAVAACVSIAGHYGAELVHKYGVGAAGHLIEQHGHHH